MSFDGDLYPTAGATSVMTTKGDIVDYDTQRQRLGIGSANQVLQVTAGGLPAWQTLSAGGAWSFVEAFTLASSAATWTITPSTALDLTSYDEFAVAVVLKHITSAGDLQLTFNGLTADFFFIGSENDSGTATSINQSTQNEVTIFGNESANKSSRTELSFRYNQEDTTQCYNWLKWANDNDAFVNGAFWNEAATTEINAIKFAVSAGSIEDGAIARIYRRASS